MPPQGQFSEFDDELQDAPQTYVFAKRTYWWSGKLGCTDGSLQLWIPPNLELRQARLTFLPFDHRADAACVQSYSIQQATCMPHVQFYHGFGSHGTHYITLHTHMLARTHACAHACARALVLKIRVFRKLRVAYMRWETSTFQREVPTSKFVL